MYCGIAHECHNFNTIQPIKMWSALFARLFDCCTNTLHADKLSASVNSFTSTSLGVGSTVQLKCTVLFGAPSFTRDERQTSDQFPQLKMSLGTLTDFGDASTVDDYVAGIPGTKPHVLTKVRRPGVSCAPFQLQEYNNLLCRKC